MSSLFRLVRRFLGLALLAAIPAQLICAQLPRELALELLRTQAVANDFDKRRRDLRLWKLEERRKVPAYNFHLNDALIEFHKHIMKDDHYLATNCGICRKHLSEIKSYSKKLEQAMQ